MASGAIVETGNEGEGDGNFNFNKWIMQNGLDEIKDNLKKHNMTTPQTIAIQSQEFRNFMSDPMVLSTKGHLIPQLFTAIDKIPKQNTKYEYINIYVAYDRLCEDNI